MEQIHHNSIAKSIGIAAVVCLALTAVFADVQDRDGSDAAGVSCGSGLEVLVSNHFNIRYVGGEGTTGEMYDWDRASDVPWYGPGAKRGFIIDEGVVSFGCHSFAEMTLLQMNIPSTLREIRDRAFENTVISCKMTFGDVTLRDHVFSGAKQSLLVITGDVSRISPTAFAGISESIIMIMSADSGIDAGTLGAGNLVLYADGGTEIVEDPVRIDRDHVRLPITSDPGSSCWIDGKRVYSDGSVVSVADSAVLRHKQSREITVSFEDTGEEPIQSQHIDIYSVPVRPADPVKKGYHFGGWTVGGVPYAFDRGFEEDTAITAQWTKVMLELTWADTDGTVLFVTEVGFGDIPARPEDPVKRGYHFAGWTVDGVPYAFDHGFEEDTVITAQWAQVMVELTWVDSDGTVLYVTEAGFGDIPARPQDPVKRGYSFAGWMAGGEPYVFDHGFEKDTTLIAKWETVKVQLLWEDGYGTVLYMTQADFGAIPERPADPERGGYDFAGWTVGGVPYVFDRGFEEDTVLTAVWTVREVEVVWRNYDGSILLSGTVDYGTVPVYDGVIPQKSQTSSTVFTFSGWEPAVGKVFEDSEFTAVFAESPRVYQVEFGPSEGIVYSENTLDVPYGSEVRIRGNELSVDGVTVKAEAESPDRSIQGWSVENGYRIQSDLCIMAVYDPAPHDMSSAAVMVLIASMIATAAVQAVLLFRKRMA